MSASVRPEDVTSLVGEIDARVVDEIVATGATLDEIAQALAAAEAALGFDDYRAVVQSPRIAALRCLLQSQLIGRDDNITRGRD